MATRITDSGYIKQVYVDFSNRLCCRLGGSDAVTDLFNKHDEKSWAELAIYTKKQPVVQCQKVETVAPSLHCRRFIPLVKV